MRPPVAALGLHLDVLRGILIGVLLGVTIGLSLGMLVDLHAFKSWVVYSMDRSTEMAWQATLAASSAYNTSFNKLMDEVESLQDSLASSTNWTMVQTAVTSTHFTEAIEQAQAALFSQLNASKQQRIALLEYVNTTYYEQQLVVLEQWTTRTSAVAMEVMASNLWWVGLVLDGFATLAGTAGKQMLRYAAVSGNPWWYPLGLVLTAVIDPAFDLGSFASEPSNRETVSTGQQRRQ